MTVFNNLNYRGLACASFGLGSTLLGSKIMYKVLSTQEAGNTEMFPVLTSIFLISVGICAIFTSHSGLLKNHRFSKA